MRESLKVTPILRYNTPKYPAHNEPNPLQIPSKKASKTGFYKTALLGIIGLFSFNNEAEAQTKENPIKFKELGFPHTYASYGTGLPDRLDRESAVAVIDSVFRANDIELQKDYGFSQGEVEFKTGGYNPKSRIGYVWLDSENTAYDCYQSYRYLYKEDELLAEDKTAYQEVKEGNYKEKVQFVRTLQQKGYYKLLSIKKYYTKHFSEELHKEIDDYLEKNPNKSDINYGEEIYRKYTKDPLDFEEIKAVVEAEDYHIGAFSRYSEYAAYYWGSKLFILDEEDDNGESVESVVELREVSGEKIALQNLAIFVQEYIDWAKSEGRF